MKNNENEGEKQHNKRLVWILWGKLIYSIYTWDPSWGAWRWILTWPPSVLQFPSSGLFSPLSERWFHSSVWSWHLNSAEGTSCLKSRTPRMCFRILKISSNIFWRNAVVLHPFWGWRRGVTASPVSCGEAVGWWHGGLQAAAGAPSGHPASHRCPSPASSWTSPFPVSSQSAPPVPSPHPAEVKYRKQHKLFPRYFKHVQKQQL